MPLIVTAVILLSAYLPAVLVAHVAISRARRSNREQPAQGAAGLAVVLTTITYVYYLVITAWHRQDPLPTVIYTAICFSLLGYIYFAMFCNTESGRRYHVVRLVSQHGGMTEQELRSAYSAKYMIEVRLERLLKWGVVAEKDGRLRVRKRTSVWVCYVFYGWSRVLGFTWRR